MYVTWRSLKTGEDCARVGRMSRCFCGCSYERHHFRKGRTLPVCGRCECQAFDFVPSRPEEVGEWWLPRRPGFDASAWRAKCKCGHTHEAHHPLRRGCESCKCGEFSSAYGCVVCDSHQEDHQTQVESARERKAAGRAVGQDFVPLSQSPELSQLTFGRGHKGRPPTTVSTLAIDGAPGRLQTVDDATSAVGMACLSSGSRARTRGHVPTPDDLTRTTRVSGKNSRGRLDSLALLATERTQTSRSTTPKALESPSKSLQHHQLPTYQDLQPIARGGRPRRRGSERDNRICTGTREANECRRRQVVSASASPSPELLYSSGRITASRYHELLAQMGRNISDQRGESGNVATSIHGLCRRDDTGTRSSNSESSSRW